MCAHYHWTWAELHWGIRWPILQRVLIDAPGYAPGNQKGAGGESGLKRQALTEHNADELISQLNRYTL